MKDRLYPMHNQSSNLNLLRQELKNRLIKIGMQIDGERQQKIKASLARKSRGKTQEDEYLPALQSYRYNKHLNNQIKQVFDFNYQKMLKHKANKKQLSKQVIRGHKCDNSMNSSRNVSPNELKQAIHKKLIESTRAERMSRKLPIMESKNFNKQRQWSETIRIMRLDQPYDMEAIERFEKRQKSQRYKTQEKDQKYQEDLKLTRSHRKIKKTLGKDLTPWEMDLNARDTNIYFH